MGTLGRYYGDLREAAARAGIVAWMLVLAWLIYPTALQTVLHPTDAIGFQNWLQGLAVPQVFTSRMVMAGEIAAVVTITGLSLFILGLTVLFFRRARYSVALWPVAGLLLGLFGNGLWWLGTGAFDTWGAVAGWSPLLLMAVAETACETMGKDFVFGKGNRPGRGEAQLSVPGM